MLRQLKQYKIHQGLIDICRTLFFTPTCLLCRQTSEDIICSYCIDDCDLSTFSSPSENLLELPAVMANRAPPLFHQLHAIGWHEGILATLINQMKFGRQPLAGKALALLFNQYVLYRLSQIDDLPDAILPVPVSNIRLIQRGFNQAQLLAEYLHQYQPINIYPAIKKNRHTRQQSRKRREARILDNQNPFQLVQKLRFDHICIIDDVLTTGATVNKISELILTSNPNAKISVWCMSLAKFNATQDKETD